MSLYSKPYDVQLQHAGLALLERPAFVEQTAETVLNGIDCDQLLRLVKLSFESGQTLVKLAEAVDTLPASPAVSAELDAWQRKAVRELLQLLCAVGIDFEQRVEYAAKCRVDGGA